MPICGAQLRFESVSMTEVIRGSALDPITLLRVLTPMGFRGRWQRHGFGLALTSRDPIVPLRGSARNDSQTISAAA